jgi:hypothetical protein
MFFFGDFYLNVVSEHVLCFGELTASPGGRYGEKTDRCSPNTNLHLPKE